MSDRTRSSDAEQRPPVAGLPGGRMEGDGMAEVVYRPSVRVVHEASGDRRAEMPGGEVVRFGVHGPIAAYYGIDPADRVPTSAGLDFLVAAAGASLTGTLVRALEARGIAPGDGRLTAAVTGEVESESEVLVLKRIHVAYYLSTGPDVDHDLIGWVVSVHADACPVYRSMHPQIGITTELQLI